MTKKLLLFRYLIPAVALISVSACQSDALSRLGVPDPTDLFESSGLSSSGAARDNREKISVNKVEFSPGHKTFSIWTSMVDDIGPYALTDSTQVRIEVEEYDDGVKTAHRSQPRLLKAVNTESDQIAQLGVKVLVLADLSLSQEQIDAQRNAVMEMRTAFDRDNLYVAFMSGNSVSQTQEVSDYILGNYFTKDGSQKYLYRSILEKLREMSGRKGPWADASSLKLVVFSDGTVYDGNDKPIDPDHFKMENELLHSHMDGKDSVTVCYVNCSKSSDITDDLSANNVMTALCESTGGIFQPGFNWTSLEKSILASFGGIVSANRFDMENPDGKVYRGDGNQVKLKFYSVKDNSLITTTTADIREGSLFRPIIVNGDPLKDVIIEGVSAGLFLMLAIYIVFQFLIPFIRYRIFRHKYVVRHTGREMAIGDITVTQTCYLCKAPFKEGDEVVVKCEHTMHKSCWDENEYHCPEYGRRCKHGSHFYNKKDLLDKRNASFYMKWLLMAVLAATLAWVVFTIWCNFATQHILEFLIPADHISAADKNGMHLNHLPFSSFTTAFFLTMGIAWLALDHKRLLSIAGVIFRSAVASLGSAFMFLLSSYACIALRLEAVGFFLNLIPWILSSFLIAFMGTYGTRIRLRKYIILVAVGVSLLSMNAWSSFYMVIGVDFRVLLLYSFILYTVGMAIAVAAAAPKSEHYFLHIQGAVKTMDIALYKWFRANPNAVVAIGKSVDCSLQLSWDLQGQVAPTHASITMRKGKPRLEAFEDGVTVSGRPLKPGKSARLFHGRQFQIGRTQFIYQEKDV